MATLTGIVAVVAMGAGYALFGPPGLWGGLSGGAVTFAFCGTTVAVMGATMRRSVPVQSAWIVGSWIAKTFLVLAAFLVLEGVNGVDRTVLGATVLVGVLGSLALDARLVLRARQTTGD
jgi:hypothetical protein